jgi:hypothetical protein
MSKSDNGRFDVELEKINILWDKVLEKGGLNDTVIELKKLQVFLGETVERLVIAVAEFSEFKTEAETVVRENEKHRISKRWLVTSLIAAGSLAATFIGMFLIK